MSKEVEGRKQGSNEADEYELEFGQNGVNVVERSVDLFSDL